MSYVRDPYDTDEPPCFCDQEAGPVLTTQEFCPAHGDPAKSAPEPPPAPVTPVPATETWKSIRAEAGK